MQSYFSQKKILKLQIKSIFSTRKLKIKGISTIWHKKIESRREKTSLIKTSKCSIGREGGSEKSEKVMI